MIKHNGITKASLWCITLLMTMMMMAGCDKKKESDPKGRHSGGTLITVVPNKEQNIPITQESLGWITSQSDPWVAAEVSGRITNVLADVGQTIRQGQPLAELDAEDLRLAHEESTANLRRLAALSENQKRQVDRLLLLEKEGLVSKSQIEEAQTQGVALVEQQGASRAQLSRIERDLDKTQIRSPVTGRVDERKAAVGDYVRVGDPLFRIATPYHLQAHLPFPEALSLQLRSGLRIRLSSPALGSSTLWGRVSEVRPGIGTGSKSLEAIVDLPDSGPWKPGGSVQGTLILKEHRSITVPEQSVIRRPAGDVVYVVKGDKAEQRLVSTGVRQEGYVEVLSGLRSGEIVALDGAGFLTDGASVKVLPGK